MDQPTSGILVISLDFEMMWGAKDWSTPQAYGKTNVAQVPYVIERLLQLFTKYGVHATFATVGFIFCKDKRDLLENAPLKKPSYDDDNLSPYSDNYIENIPKELESLYFAPGLIRKISSISGMEIATHTACHYNCSAAGQTTEEFQEDLLTAKKMAGRDGYELKSIVFPRNQVGEDYLKVCDNNGILIYRGNAIKFFNNGLNIIERIKNRLCRLLDNYIPLDKTTVYPLSNISEGKRFNIRASRFLRPYSNRLSLLEWMRCHRMKGEMAKAAKKGAIYHIWWHPHNFGANIDKNFEFLENLLKHYAYCREKYGMKSMNMLEVAELIGHNNG